MAKKSLTAGAVPAAALQSHRQTSPAAPAWITGAVAAVVLLLAVFYFRETPSVNLFDFGGVVMAEGTRTALAILLAAWLAMVMTEAIRQDRIGLQPLWTKAPALNVEFWVTGLLRYLEHVALLWIIQVFYRTADEYGFASKHPFYLPWHQFYDLFFTAYCWLGLPYVLLTRAFRWNSQIEERDYGLLLELGARRLIGRLPGLKHRQLPGPRIDVKGKPIFLDLLVKLFFLPLMFVFFCDQLTHLLNNLNYLAAGMPRAYLDGQFQHTQWNFDIANFLVSLLFTLHTGLAFCAIALSQRWLPRVNQVNHHLAGWLACLLTFPPFLHMVITQHIPGVTGPHLDGPSQVLAQLPSQWLLTLAIVVMGICYGIYLLATINLGVHYSELTNRGIVRTGPYAWVRHPAYSAKLIGWLCVLLPLVGLNMIDGNWTVAGSLTGAYAIGLALYYWRAITEERHLGEDPEYQLYVKQVPWRFLPKLF